jgi:hypothetical protein
MTVAIGAVPSGLWTGLSGDAKPSKAINSLVKQGDMFLETDTRNLYQYLAASDSWVLAVPLYDLRTLLAGEKLPNSAASSYLDSSTQASPVLLDSIATLNVSAGAFTGASPFIAGVTGDTRFLGLHILSNATAVTVTVTGFGNTTGAAVSKVYTGSTTVDTFINLNGFAEINNVAAMTITASVANKAWVYMRPAG